MNRKSKAHNKKTLYAKLEDRKLLAADFGTTCPAPELSVTASVEQVASQPVERGELQRESTSELPLTSIVNDNINVTDIQLGDGSISRSSIDQILLTFDGVVAPEDGAFLLIQRDSGTSVDLEWTVDNSSGASQLTLTFSGSLSEPGGSLKDGNYELRVEGDLLGGALPGSDFAFGTEETDNFFRYFGDADANRSVNVRDLLPFRKSYLHSAPEPQFDPQFDVDGNGTIDVIDLLPFRKNYRGTLDWV